MLKRLLFIATGVTGIILAQDPPGRVGRLNYIAGSVSFQPAGVTDWVPAVVNRPLTVGDQLWADQDSRAELHIPGAAFRLNSQTSFQFLNLDDQNAQIRLSAGALDVRVRRMGDNDVLEVDTPNAAFSILRPGEYRIETNPDTSETFVTIRSGQGEVTGGGQAFTLHANEQAHLSGSDQITYDVYGAPGADDFDQWCQTRNVREDRPQQYVSADMVGYEDLSDYGSWRPAPDYGMMWVPQGVVAGWAPYHYGHWAWVDPWGWTWVDDAPWGFAPFHYGRWAYVGGVWGWIPGPATGAPIYAPALVAWVGGAGFNFGVSFGGGAGVGWFPLGPRDVFIPSYQVSPAYVTRVNVTNTTVINNVQVTNVYNTYTRTGNVSNITYTNQRVPGAFVAVPQNALASARPVQQAVVKVPENQLANMKPASAAPQVAPQREAVLGHPASAMGHAPAPPAAAVNVRVVAKTTPPPPPVPFAQKQALLTQNAGRPLSPQQQQQVRKTYTPPATQPVTRVAGQVKHVTPTVSSTPRPQTAPPSRPPAVAPAPASRTYQPQPQGQPPKVNAPPVQPPAQQPKSYQPPPPQTPRPSQPPPQERVQQPAPKTEPPPQQKTAQPPPRQQPPPAKPGKPSGTEKKDKEKDKQKDKDKQ